MGSRLEINFNRLLFRCENMAKERSLWDWRIEKVIPISNKYYNYMYCNLAQRILHLSCRIDITTDITDYNYRRWPGISSNNKTLKLS